jgi:hypothetical protein
MCTVTYVLATPDGIPESELTARFWRHLEPRASAATARRKWPSPCHKGPAEGLLLRSSTSVHAKIKPVLSHPAAARHGSSYSLDA